jgi:hypothetical protein
LRIHFAFTSAVQFLAHSPEGSAREDRLDRQAEELRDPEGKLQAGVVLAALHVADGLVADAQGVGELGPAKPAFRAQHRDAVVELVGPVYADGHRMISPESIIRYTAESIHLLN